MPATCLFCESSLRPNLLACPACGRFQQVHWARAPLLRRAGERTEAAPMPHLLRLRQRFVRWLREDD